MQSAAPPTSGDKLPLDDLKGSLLYVAVAEKVRGIETQFGVSDAVKCSVAVLDGARKCETFGDTLIFPRLLQRQLELAIGGPDNVVVGRLTRGDARPGKSAPWLLDTPTAADIDTATKYAAYAAKQAAEQDEPF